MLMNTIFVKWTVTKIMLDILFSQHTEYQKKNNNMAI